MQLADLTTLRLGGPAGRLVEARTEDDVVAAVREADAAGEPLLVLAGGSNVVVADEGFPGAVVLIATRGVERTDEAARALLDVQAGEPWDPFVERCVADGLAGVECLSGIPGSVGATPIQNVGAYGQEVAETIVAVRALDRTTGEVRELSGPECGFAYRSSAFKRAPGRWVVLAVRFALARSDASQPLRYAELARALGVEQGERAPLADVRAAVLDLRRGKGMVIDPDDPDSVSAGSFFTNPILTPRRSRRSRPAHTSGWARTSACRAGPSRRPREDLGGLADRALGVHQGPWRPRDDRDLGQAHARADQPRRGDHGAARRAGPRGRRRRRARLRRRAAARAGLRRTRLVSRLNVDHR
jgi:UDP-N-acetylmuramate dehydrogenase